MPAPFTSQRQSAEVLNPATELAAATSRPFTAALNVFVKRDGKVHLFWAAELGFETADPGQDPRGAPDLAPLWNYLDMTPEGRDPAWYPRLEYATTPPAAMTKSSR